ncbi:hypothetical protein L4G92_00030 [Neisseria sp. ZJ106]|uniref:Uncharacterized protein n=1 Tax=Neisseria lisongii TaxID=2912188 RepID=A0ABY7RJ96_9NEIS|nr:hypothetical protein [Neisseria lisongii]MCF7520446.1 hypothetical protein [Neisseria lisongii]WCL71611.1 hypothetical protein PJU73_00330 [Neisseria lisongii]
MTSKNQIPNTQSPKTHEVSEELLARLSNAAYFLETARYNIARSYIPVLKHLLQHNQTYLADNLLDALNDYLIELEQHNGEQASIDINELMHG